MLQPVFVTCPRGHYYKAGRVSPGLVIRIKSKCTRCGEYHISFGAVAPFAGEIVPTHDAGIVTGITAGMVRRELEKLSDRSDVADLLARIPADDTQLSAGSVLLALSTWIRHMGRKGAAVAERGQLIEIVANTGDPASGAAYIRGLTAAA